MSLGEVTIQGQQYRFASDDKKLAPAACRFESHDMKSIINLSNKVTLTLTHKYMNIFMEESQGLHDLKKLKYIGCIFNRVVVKANTKSANHSIFSPARSISTILFTIQLSRSYLT